LLLPALPFLRALRPLDSCFLLGRLRNAISVASF